MGTGVRDASVDEAGAPTTVRETERKYESAQPLGVELIGELAAAAGGAAPSAPTRADLSATYYDTEDLRLLRSRMTLRRRRGGHDAGWHLKLPAGADSRDEVRQPLGRHRKPPAPLVALSRAAHRDAPLRPVVELDTVREEWTLTDDRGEAVATVTDDRVTARHLDTGVGRGTGVDTEPLEWAEIEVELAGKGTPEVLDRIEEALLRAGVQRSASASKLGRVLADRIPPAPPRPVADPDGDRGRRRARLRDRAGRGDPGRGPAGPPRRPGLGARHAGGLPPDAQHLPVLPRAARPQPHRRPRRRAALAGGRAGRGARPGGPGGADHRGRRGAAARARPGPGRRPDHAVLRDAPCLGRRRRDGRAGQRPLSRAARRRRRAAGRPPAHRRRRRNRPSRCCRG